MNILDAVMLGSLRIQNNPPGNNLMWMPKTKTLYLFTNGSQGTFVLLAQIYQLPLHIYHLLSYEA